MTTEREMPPLPETYYALGVLSDGWSREYLTHLDGYTDYQMREYAIAYAAQEIEKVCAIIMAYPHWLGDNAKRELCEAIRARGNT
jgi:hypothetical protein